MKKAALLLFGLLVCLYGFAEKTGPSKEYNLVFDFQDSWLVYEMASNKYLPEKQSTSYHLLIDLKEYPNTSLLVKAGGKDNFLFLNGSFVNELKDGGWLVLGTNDLLEKYGNGLLNLTIYSKSKTFEKQVLVASKNNSSALIKSDTYISSGTIASKLKAKEIINILPRNVSVGYSPLIVSFIFLLSLIGFLIFFYPKSFKKYFSIIDLFNTNLNNHTLLLKGVLNSPNWMFVLLLANFNAFLVILYLFIAQKYNLPYYKITFFSTIISSRLILYSLYVGVFIVGLIVKYFVLFFGAKIFNFDKYINIHFFRVLQSSLIFYSLLTIVCLVLVNLNVLTNSFIITNFVYLIIGFYLFRVLIIFLTINRQHFIQFLYLISYLCVVEIFPIVLGFKILT